LIFNIQAETAIMQTKSYIALGIAAAILAGSNIARAADDSTAATATRTQEQTRLQTPDTGTRNELDQRNRIWSMQGATDGSYTGNAEKNKVQTRTQEQIRTRTYQGTGTGSRYGQGYESRQGGGGFGSGPGGGGRSGGSGGGGGGGRH
jgi:uncharacterized membrane protein YgcG